MAELPIILVVEDDFSIQAMIEDALNEAGYETAVAPSAEEAVTLLRIPGMVIRHSRRS